jgi:hypothetical protein
MSGPLERLTTRVAYTASQLPRVAWYVGHGIAMRMRPLGANMEHRELYMLDCSGQLRLHSNVCRHSVQWLP